MSDYTKFIPKRYSLVAEFEATIEQQRVTIQQRDGEIERLTAQVERLSLYVSHGLKYPPDSPLCESSKHSDYPCTCGLNEALKANKQHYTPEEVEGFMDLMNKDKGEG